MSKNEFMAFAIYKGANGTCFDFLAFENRLKMFDNTLPNGHTFFEDERSVITMLLNTNPVLPIEMDSLFKQHPCLKDKTQLNQALQIIDHCRFKHSMRNHVLNMPEYLTNDDTIKLLLSGNGIYSRIFFSVISQDDFSFSSLGIVDPEFFMSLHYANVLVWGSSRYIYFLDKQKYHEYKKNLIKQKIENL